jgi:hypothetical protein
VEEEMIGALALPITIPTNENTASTEEMLPAKNIVRLEPKKSDVAQYLEIYSEAFQVFGAMTPPGLYDLILPNRVRIRYTFVFLMIEPLWNGTAYEIKRDVEVPDELAELAGHIATLVGENMERFRTGSVPFRRNYDQDAMTPVLDKTHSDLLVAAMQGTQLVQKKYGNLLREFGVMPKHAQNPLPAS